MCSGRLRRRGQTRRCQVTGSLEPTGDFNPFAFSGRQSTRASICIARGMTPAVFQWLRWNNNGGRFRQQAPSEDATSYTLRNGNSSSRGATWVCVCVVVIIINGGCDFCCERWGVGGGQQNQEVRVRYVNRDNTPYLLFPSCQRGLNPQGRTRGGSLKVEQNTHQRVLWGVD